MLIGYNSILLHRNLKYLNIFSLKLEIEVEIEIIGLCSIYLH